MGLHNVSWEDHFYPEGCTIEKAGSDSTWNNWGSLNLQKSSLNGLQGEIILLTLGFEPATF